MDALYSCAAAYASLLKYEYTCVIGRKNLSRELMFSFSPYEFKHLAGLHKLQYQKLYTSSPRILKEALALKLTVDDLKRASNWAQYEGEISSRLTALAGLEYIMDDFREIFWFSQAAANANGINTRLPNGYLIKFPLADGRVFYFSVQSGHAWIGDSIFINDTKDYSKAQCQYVLLKKVKRNMATGAEECLYLNKNYQPQDT